MVLGIASIVNPLNVDLSAYFFDIAAAFILSLMLVFITANRLYNRSAGIVLMVVLALVIHNGF